MMMVQGIEDSLTGRTLQLTQEQMTAIMTQFQRDLIAKRQEQIEKQGDINKAKGAKFLEDNKHQPDVVVLASGLQYKILTPGSGMKPKKEDTVTVEYTGHLIDGRVFDSTDKSGQPATF